MIQVENVYEEILHQTLLEEALKGENILEVTGITLQPVAHEVFLQSFPDSSPGCSCPTFPNTGGYVPTVFFHLAH